MTDLSVTHHMKIVSPPLHPRGERGGVRARLRNSGAFSCLVVPIIWR